MNGSIVPARAAFFSAECSCGHDPVPLRSSQRYGEVGSHGSSQRWLRSRISLHAFASRSLGGRNPTGPASSVAGQPGVAHRFESSSGITVTREPATTSVTSSSITTRQFAAAMRGDEVRARPADERDAVTAGRLAVQDAAAVLPHARRALDRLERRRLDGRAVQHALAEQLADGRTDEHLERDQRADRVAGQAEDRDLVAEVPEALRLAGLHRDLGELDGAELGQRLLDHVERAHRDAAAGHQDVRAQQLALEDVQQRRVIVRDDAVPLRVRAGVLRRRREQVGVRVADLAEARPLPDVDQFAAGADHDHARARAGRARGRDRSPRAARSAAGRARRRRRGRARRAARSSPAVRTHSPARTGR